MKKERKKLFENLKAQYSAEEAKELIDRHLEKYGPTCKIEFRKRDAEITDSYKVKSAEDRCLICEIIARTGLTNRNFEDLAAEWEVHNVSWDVHVLRKAAKDVSLDYGGDPRLPVRAATLLFEKLNID